ncbi:MAG: hypothetical protein LBH44_04015 [Treponema sp.]|jgi:hypothetical protein|nr:hypothetical protein [Treponema sp.]
MGNNDFGAVGFRQSVNDFPCSVELGNASPSFGIKRFNKALRFCPTDDEGFTLRGDKRRLLYKGRRRSHRFTIHGDNAFEYDCILHREPEINVIALLIEGAEHFDFFRQPDFVRDPFLKGSYAVYKKETLLGDGTGKLCHIHRPEIIDAKGRRCWGDLAVIGNELRITVPDWFLSSAKYPVIVDPTIGTSTVGSLIYGTDPNNSYYDRPMLDNEVALNKFLVPQNGGGLCTAYVYAYFDESDTYATPCMYTNIDNKPYQKKSKNEKGVNVDVWNNAGWRNNTFEIDGNITAGDYVWFGVHSGWFTTRFDYGLDCYKTWFDWETYEDYDGLPTPFIHIGKWDTFCNIKWSWYFTYVGAQNYVRTITQGVKLSDNRNLIGTYKRSITQTARVNSTLNRFETFYRNCVMTAHNTMNIQRFPVFFRTVAEQLKILMGISENRTLSRKCADNVNANSETKRIISALRTVQDGLKIIDAQSVFILFVRSIYDSEIVADHSRQWGSFIRNLFVTAGSIAETAHSANYYRYQADTVQAQGSVFRGLLLFVRIITRLFIRDYLLGRFLKAKQELILKSAVTREIKLETKIE